MQHPPPCTSIRVQAFLPRFLVVRVVSQRCDAQILKFFPHSVCPPLTRVSAPHAFMNAIPALPACQPIGTEERPVLVTSPPAVETTRESDK